MTTARDAGRKGLTDASVDADLWATVNRIETTGRGAWEFDPQVDGVVGLLDVRTGRAFVVVYLDDDDFETSQEFDAFEREPILPLNHKDNPALGRMVEARPHGWMI